MNGTVGNTDHGWYQFLRARPEIDDPPMRTDTRHQAKFQAVKQTRFDQRRFSRSR